MVFHFWETFLDLEKKLDVSERYEIAIDPRLLIWSDRKSVIDISSVGLLAFRQVNDKDLHGHVNRF
jgi:hypothetical protein